MSEREKKKKNSVVIYFHLSEVKYIILFTRNLKFVFCISVPVPFFKQNTDQILVSGGEEEKEKRIVRLKIILIPYKRKYRMPHKRHKEL